MRKKKFWKAAVLLIVLAAVGIGCVGRSKKNKASDIEWPKSELAQKIPALEGKGEVYDYSTSLMATKLDATEQDWKDYIAKCQDRGFTVDSSESSISYEAWDSEDYKVRISFYESSKDLSVTLDAPEKLEKMSWPTSKLAQNLPEAKISKGKMIVDSSDELRFYAEMDKEARAAYAQSCYDAGFDIDYDRSDTLFTASSKAGMELKIQQESPNCVLIELRAGDGEKEADMEDDKEPAEAAEDSSQTQALQTPSSEESGQTSSKTGISDDFKKFVDSYEQFMMDYCDFMERFAEQGSPASMMGEYMDLLGKYETFMTETAALDEDEMTPEELKYYLDAQNRVTQRMATMAS